MGSVASAAKVDGVDLQAMVSAVPAFARPPTAQVEARTDTEADTRISSAGKLRGATSAVLEAAARLSKPQTWTATRAQSDNEAAVQATSDKAAVGEHSVNVDSLAAAQATSSATFSSLSTVIGLGTLNIEIGSWNTSQTAFATNPNWPKADVVLGPKDRSLERIKDKINAAGMGVIATVVSDATGSRLVLRSTATGSDNGFKVTTEAADKSDADAAQTLAALGFDPSALQNKGGGRLLQAAQDAKLTIDGRPVQSPQNLVEDEASGLSLRLHQSGQGEVGIRVEADTGGISQQVHAFAQAYNDMALQLAQQPAAGQDASVQAAQGVRQRMQEVLRPAGGPSPMSAALKSVGVQMNREGRIEVDAAKLGKALAQSPDKVAKLMAGEEGPGLAARLKDLSADAPAAAGSSLRIEQRGEAPVSAAGALYRQRLLEQYAPVPQAADEGTAMASSLKHEEDPAMSANAA